MQRRVSEQSEFLIETEEPNLFQRCRKRLTKRTLIGIGVGVVVFVLTVVIIVVAVKHEKNKSSPVNSSTIAPSNESSTETSTELPISSLSTEQSAASPSIEPHTANTTIEPFTSSLSTSATTKPTGTTASTSTTVPPTPGPDDMHKLECVGGKDDADRCIRVECTWERTTIPGVPSCILPKPGSNKPFGYKVAEYDVGTESVHLELSKPGFFGRDFKKVRAEVTNIDENVVRIQFLDDENMDHYQVPIELNTKSSNPPKAKQVYDVVMETDPKKPFSFKVLRKGNPDPTVIFDTSVGSLFLAERHIEVTTKLPSKNVYGIGESTHKTFRHDLNNFNKWPLFSRDQPPDPWDGEGRYNLYGVHPYYMCLEDSGKAHGVLFLNSNAMEVTLTPMPALTYRSTGGILDIFFFLGENPEHVTQVYTNIIGRPMIPPYWGLGFQLSHYGYNSLENMKKTIARTRDKGFPLDVVHADIDLMNENKDFTWDNKRFPQYNEFVNTEKEMNGLRFIIILDPALLANDSSYWQYKTGEDADVYIKWPKNITQEERNNPPYPGINTDKDIMFGQVWPKGPVAFPDFFKNSTKKWWETCISVYRTQLDFDALWIDMNEPSCFGTDQEEPWFCPQTDKKCWALKCPDNEYDRPNTFIPAAVSVYTPQVRLSDKTICMAAVQGNNGEYTHYDVHSLYGWSETESTYRALKDTAKEDQVPLVISRSTYPSSGRHAGHWLGDNFSTWQSMRSSIVGVLEFNLFGIPYIGADICGFGLNTTSELCGRWMQLGAFYPFCRNHNSINNIDQDPGSDLLTETDRERARLAMVTRYQLLPYLHTLHYLAHANGNTVVRALMHEFPTDVNTYGIQEQFMWGPSLLISPALYQGMTSLRLYLPEDLWYDFYESIQVEKISPDRRLNVTNLEVVPLHVRAGSILALKEKGANSTKFSRDLDFEIRVYPKNGVANGVLYWMAREAKDIDDPKFFRLYEFDFNKTRMAIKLLSNETLGQPNRQVIGRIIFCGQENKPLQVRYEGKPLNEKEYSHDSKKKILTVNYSIDLEALQPKNSTRTLDWS